MLGEDKGHWIVGKEGKEDKQEENGIFIKHWTMLLSVSLNEELCG